MAKGISPFIAAIFLIAFVVAVGAVVSPWLTSFTKGKTADVEYKSEDQIDCIFSSLDFTSSGINYNLTTTPDWVNITMDNTGSCALYNFEISLTVDNEVKIYPLTATSQRTSANPLEPGERIILITNVTDNLPDSGTLQKVRVVAKNCPHEAKKEVTL